MSCIGNHHAKLLTLENALLILIMCDLFASLYFYFKPNCMDAQTQIVHWCHWKDSLVPYSGQQTPLSEAGYMQ